MKNEYEIRGTDTAIFLKKRDGTVVETLISTCDLDMVNEFPNTWYHRGRYVYGMSDRKNPKDKGTLWSLHRLISKCPDGMVTDHINRNKLDNRRENLRNVTVAENNQNVGVQKNTISGVRGVTWDKHKRMWKASSRIDGKLKFLGLFTDVEEAKQVAAESRLKHMPYSQESTDGIEFSGKLEKHKVEIKTKAFRHNITSGIRGISWHSQSKSWRVSIMIKKKIHSSLHKNIDDAKNALNKLLEFKDTLV